MLRLFTMIQWFLGIACGFSLRLAAATPEAGPLSAAAQERVHAVVAAHGTLRLVVASPGYMWGMDRQIKAELQAAGMTVLAYPDLPMMDPNQPPRVSSWEQISRYNVLIFGDSFLNSAEPDPQTGQLPSWIQNTASLLRRFLEEGGGIFFCGNGEANFGNVVAYNFILNKLGLDAQVIGEQVKDPATLAGLPNRTGVGRLNWCWTDTIQEDPLTVGVKGLWYPFACGGDGGLSMLPIQAGPEWKILVRGLPSAGSFAVDRGTRVTGSTSFLAVPGVVKSSPALVAARQDRKGRVVLWPMWTHFGVLCGSAPGVGGWLMDGEHQGRRSDGARLLENLLCWLAEPSQGSTTIGLFDPAKTPVAKPPPPDLSPESAAWTFPLGKMEFPKQFKGLIGAHSSLSDGSSTPEEQIVAAKIAGYDFMAFTEDLARMDKTKYETLVETCRKANAADPAFASFPGLDFLTDAGDRNLVFGLPTWPLADSFSTHHPGRLTWLYALTYQASNVPDRWPPLVIIRSQANAKRPWIQGLWSAFAPYCYEGGKLVDDSLKEWRPLIGRHGFHSVADLLAVHTVRNAREISQSAQPGLFQTMIRANRLSEVLGRLSGSKWTRGQSANYISTGPVIQTFTTEIVGISEGADLAIPGNNRGRLHVRVSADAGLKEINLHDGERLWRRIIPEGNRFEAVFTFHPDSLHAYSLEAIDRQERRALSWTAWAGVYERVHRRGGDNWNWMVTGKPRRGPSDYVAWNGMEAFGFAADAVVSYAADQADYTHSGLRMTWFDAYLASRNQGGLLVEGRYEDRYPSRTMDFVTVGRYGSILVNRFPEDMVVREPPNYTFREMSGPYAVIPSAWPAEITEYIPEPRFNGTRIARSVGRVRFARKVETAGGAPISVNLGIATEFSVNPTRSRQGVLEVVAADGAARRYVMGDLKGDEEYQGEIPLNGYVCWHGPDAPGLGGIIALSPGIHFALGRSRGDEVLWRGAEHRLKLFMPVPSPARPGTEVKWDCLPVTGSLEARNNREEMETIMRGLGLRGKPALYRVQPRLGSVGDDKFLLTLQTEDHAFSGRIERTTDQLAPIPLPVMVQGLNPRWDACVWYRGRTQLEVVRKFRDPWGMESPYRMTGAYEPRVDEIQYLPLLGSGQGYCQLDTDRQAADVFIGHPLVCDQPLVFLTLVQAAKDQCVFEINNPTDQTLRCTVRPSKGFELTGDFHRTVVLAPGQFQSVTVGNPAGPHP